LADALGHEQLDELSVSDNQAGVPLHTPGISLTCL